MRLSAGTHHSIFMASSAIALILLCAHHARAQETVTLDDTESVQLKTINVQKNDDTASMTDSVSHISKTTLNRFGGEKLDDVLRSTPGVFTLTNSSNPGVAVNIRGFEGSGRVNMMIDGAPQTFRTTAHDAQGYSYIDPNLLSSIDITRGAVTTEGGSGLAGNINFRTLGVDDILLEGNDKGVLGRLSWGSNGVGFSEMLAGAARVNQTGIAAALSHRGSNDYKNGDGTTIRESGQELTSGLFKAEFKNDEHSLTLGGVLYNNTYGTYGYFPAMPEYGMPETHIFSKILLQNRTFTANYNYNPSDNDLIDLSANAYHNYTKLTYQEGSASTIGREITNKSTGLSVSNTSRFTFDSSELAWKYGFEYNHDNTDGVKTGPNPVDSSTDRGAVFTQAELTLGDFQALAGLRYNYYSLDGSADSGIAGFENDGLYSTDQSKGLWNPKVTLSYNVTDWLQPYVTYSHSMRAPTLQETMVGGTHPGGTSASYIPNPYLQPEEQRGWDLGVNIHQNDLFMAGDTVRLKANYFNMDIKNYIAAQRNQAFGKLQFVNIEGTSRVQGFELETNYDSDAVFGGISYTHNKSDLPSQTPGLGASQYQPENIVSATLGGYFFEQKLSAGVKYSYVSSGLVAAADQSGNVMASTKSDPYSLVDVFASYKFTPNIEVSFQVKNLLNKVYTPSLSTTLDSGQGRTFLVATQFQF